MELVAVFYLVFFLVMELMAVFLLNLVYWQIKIFHHLIYDVAGRVQSIAFSVSVCLSVCPLVCVKNHTPKLYEYSVHVTCGRGLVAPVQQCNTLCVDDIRFSHNHRTSGA